MRRSGAVVCLTSVETSASLIWTMSSGSGASTVGSASLTFGCFVGFAAQVNPLLGHRVVDELGERVEDVAGTSSARTRLRSVRTHGRSTPERTAPAGRRVPNAGTDVVLDVRLVHRHRRRRRGRSRRAARVHDSARSRLIVGRRRPVRLWGRASPRTSPVAFVVLLRPRRGALLLRRHPRTSPGSKWIPRTRRRRRA